MVKVARPWVLLRTVVAYPNISESGTIALITCPPPLVSMPWIWPRRAERSPMTSPMKSSGTTTSTSMIGSNSTGLALFKASCIAMLPAIWNAISEESTSW
jgi:hypothetical protein